MNVRKISVTCLILILLTTFSVIASASLVYEENWEDGDSDLDRYAESTVSGQVSVVNTRSHTGTYSLELKVDDSGGQSGERHAQVTLDDTFSVDLNNDVNITSYLAYTQSGFEQSSNVIIEIFDSSGDDILVVWERDANEWNIDGSLIDPSGTDDVNSSPLGLGSSFTEVRIETDGGDDTIFVYRNNTQILNAELTSSFSNPNQVKIRYRHDAVLAGAPYDSNGYFDDITINSDIPPEKSLEIDANNFMEPNQTQPYIINYNVDGSLTDVSDNVTLTSNNTTLLTVDNTNNTFIAGNNTSIGGVAQVNGSYTDDEGETIDGSLNITVAPASLEFWKLLPFPKKIQSMLITSSAHPLGPGPDGYTGASTFQWLLWLLTLSIAIGYIAGEWFGVGTFVTGLAMGWAVGWVHIGTIVVTLLLVVVMMLLAFTHPSNRADVTIESNEF